MTKHGRISSLAQILVHSRTWRTAASALKDGRTDLKRQVPQGRQVNSGNDNVSSQQPRVDLHSGITQQRLNTCQMFLLNKSNLSFGFSIWAAVMFAIKPKLLNGFC